MSFRSYPLVWDNITNSTTTTPLPSAPPVDSHPLLSFVDFLLLCVVVSLCYYAALCVCTMAVGESYAGLVSPFAFLRSLLVDLFHALRNGRSSVVGVDASLAEEDPRDIFNVGST